MTVTYELPGLSMRRRETKADEDVVQPALELGEQVFAGDALLPHGLFEIGAELVFEHAVDAFYFLFFAQLEAVSDNLRLSIAPMLARSKVPLLDAARGFETTLAFEE